MEKKTNNITGAGTHRSIKESELPYKPTELEPVMIIGNFSVYNFDNRIFTIKNHQKISDIKNLTGNGFSFYSGRFSFETELSLKKKPLQAELCLGNVSFPCVEIRINKRLCKVLIAEPYTCDVKRFLKEGKNKINIICPTDMFNLLGPNTAPIEKPEFTGPHSFRSIKEWTEKKYLCSYGIGEVFLNITY